MEEMIQYFESEGSILDSLNSNYTAQNFLVSSGYVSMITIGGRPILPPVMTDEKRQEMLGYKRQAQIAETRLRNRRREKLRAKVNAIVKDIESRTPTPRSADISPSSDCITKEDSSSSCPEEESNQTDSIESRFMVAESKPPDILIVSESSSGKEAQAPDTIKGAAFTQQEMPKSASVSEGPTELTSSSCDSKSSDIGSTFPNSSEKNGQSADSVKESIVMPISAVSSVGSTEVTSSSGSSGSSCSTLNKTVIERSELPYVSSMSNRENDRDNDKSDTINREKSHSSLNSGEQGPSSEKTICDQEKVKLSYSSAAPTVETCDIDLAPSAPDDSNPISNINSKPTAEKARKSDSEIERNDSGEAITNIEQNDNINNNTDGKDNLTAGKKHYFPEVSSSKNGEEKEYEDCDVGSKTQLPLLERVLLQPDDDQRSEPEQADLDEIHKGHIDDGGLESIAASPTHSIACQSDCMSYIGDYVTLPSPGPVLTPDVSRIARVIPGAVSCENSAEKTTQTEVRYFPDLPSGGNVDNQYGLHSQSASLALNTASTDLQPYMLNSLDTISSSFTLKDEEHEPAISASPSGMNEATSNVPVEAVTPTACQSRKEHVRRGSYTLEGPSPALLASGAKRDPPTQQVRNTADKQVGVKPTATQEVPVMSSRTAQRRLDYNKDINDEMAKPTDSLSSASSQQGALFKPTNQGDRRRRNHSEEEGRQQHLQRYLQQLSEQPITALLHGDEPASGESAGTVTGNMAEEDLLHLQTEEFERYKKQMLEEHERQLELLLQQQHQQQLLLQQELSDCINTSSAPYSQNTNTSLRHVQAGRDNSNSAAYAQNTDTSLSLIQGGRDDSISASYAQINDSSLRHVQGGRNNSNSASLSQPGKPSPSVRYFAPPAVSPVERNRRPSPKAAKTRSPVQHSPKHKARTSPLSTAGKKPVRIPSKALDSGMQSAFEKVSAAVKGYLTRRLLRTQKVQDLIKTIRDVAVFAVSFQSETPIKRGQYTMQDLTLQERVIAQLNAALLDLHDVFFMLSRAHQMAIIAADRELLKEKWLKEKEQKAKAAAEKRRVSTATLKAMERKKQAKAAEARVFGQARPKTAPPSTSASQAKRIKTQQEDISGPIRRQYKFIMSRALKPIQGQQSPGKPLKKETENTKLVTTARPKTAPPGSRPTLPGVRSVAGQPETGKNNVGLRSARSKVGSRSPRTARTGKPRK